MVGWSARVTILALNLCTLVIARLGAPILVLLAVVGVSLGTLYLLDSRHRGFGFWTAYLLGFVLFAHLRTLADDTDVAVRGRYALEADKWLFAGTLPTKWLQDHLLTRRLGALEIVCATVYLSYFVVPHLVALVLWKTNAAAFKRYALSVLIAVYTGLAICLAVPTAPPWLAGRFAAGPHLARVLTDAVALSPERAGADSGVAGTNPFAAMPSLHMAVTALVVFAAWRRPLLRSVAMLYGIAMAFTLVFMGEHYVVDELAGIATAVWALALTTRLLRQRETLSDVRPVRNRGRMTAPQAVEGSPPS